MEIMEGSKLVGGSYEDTTNATSKKLAKEKKKACHGFTMEEVAKNTKKGDVWVVLHGRVLHVSNFLSQHLLARWLSRLSQEKTTSPFSTSFCLLIRLKNTRQMLSQAGQFVGGRVRHGRGCEAQQER